jgi:pimeloyl-ACP methyl ester carboxylesterase
MGAPRFLVRSFRSAPSKRRFFRSLVLGSKGGNRTVTSADGVDLSVRVTGDGAPLVLVHGALDGMNSFAFVEPTLTERWRVWTYDRRGRGGSGDADGDYVLQLEAGDLRAIVESIGEPTHVIGHSYGALVAMRAALDGLPMRSLVLYEPPINGDAVHDATVEEIERLVAAERPDDVIRMMARDLAGVTDDELSIALAVPPVRKALRDGTRTIVRELRTAQRHSWFELPIRGVPTLLLQGERRSSPAYPSDEQASEIAEDVTVATIDDQGHLATTFAPQAFLAAVEPFLADHEPSRGGPPA